MSKEMLLKKFTGHQSLTTEPSIATKTNKDSKRRNSIMLVLAAAVVAVALISITLLAPVTFYHDNKNSSIGDSTYRTTKLSDMGSSATGIDGNGVVIQDNGLTESAQITITGYSEGIDRTVLSCSINSFPAFCDGGPVTLAGLPPGEHIFLAVEHIDDEIASHSFSWEIEG